MAWTKAGQAREEAKQSSDRAANHTRHQNQQAVAKPKQADSARGRSDVDHRLGRTR